MKYGFLAGKKKFFTMIVGVCSGVAIALGCDAGDVSTVSGAVVAIVAVVAGIVTEGRIDVARITNAANAVNNTLDALDAAGKALTMAQNDTQNATESDEKETVEEIINEADETPRNGD